MQTNDWLKKSGHSNVFSALCGYVARTMFTCFILALLCGSLTGCKQTHPETAPPMARPPETAPPPDTAPPADDGIKSVRLFYATDRKRTGDTNAIDLYGGDRITASTQVEYGVCQVTIPPHHRFASLESYKWWRFETKNVSERHVTLLKVSPLVENDFFTQLRQTVADSGDKELFVFIHGYNVSWEDSARRAGQIAYDIGLDASRGAPLLYSWASKGEMLAYLKDGNNVRTAGQRLRHVLTNVIARAGARRVNILAHSMGNQALNFALESIGMSTPELAAPPFDQVIMAAPDLDIDQLELSAQAMRRTARRFTIYSCQSDRPVKLSAWLHGTEARVGSFALLDGFDTIDTTLLQIDGVLNHSYIGDAPPVLRDLRKLVQSGCSVTDRCCCCFQSATEPSGMRKYWVFKGEPGIDCSHKQPCRHP